MVKRLARFLANELGLESIEYTVVTALVVAALVTSATLLVDAITGRFGLVSTLLNP